MITYTGIRQWLCYESKLPKIWLSINSQVVQYVNLLIFLVDTDKCGQTIDVSDGETVMFDSGVLQSLSETYPNSKNPENVLCHYDVKGTRGRRLLIRLIDVNLEEHISAIIGEYIGESFGEISLTGKPKLRTILSESNHIWLRLIKLITDESESKFDQYQEFNLKFDFEIQTFYGSDEG